MKSHGRFETADTLDYTISGTGVPTLDKLLGGGYEHGLMHLFYGDSVFQDDLLRAAVWAQVPKKRGGFESPVIVIDSSNMINFPSHFPILSYLKRALCCSCSTAILPN